MRRPDASIHDRVLAELELRTDCKGAIEEIPAAGPLVVVANHPFGIVEGPTLGALLERVRPDVMFVTNSLLAQLPELRDRIFAVDPYGGAAQSNAAAVRGALRHLRRGGALVVFPAGEVSSMRPPLGWIQDAPWQSMAARLAMKTEAAILPVYFAGSNRPHFHLAGLVHASLRTLLLPSEMLSQRKRTIRIVIGHPVKAARYRSADRLTRHLRHSTYRLARQLRHAPVAPSPESTDLAREIGKLAPILETEGYSVYLEKADRIPVALQEIARLRELSFRAVGEGTGRDKDLDDFDFRYWHLFVWRRDANEIAGAYRLADGAEQKDRIYCETLFRFPRDWKIIQSQGVELGRSFVRSGYQRDLMPLLLLWQGIGRFVKDRPHIRYLFGPVSISADYTPAARALISSFFNQRWTGVQPRNLLTGALNWRPGQVWRGPRDIEALGKRVAELEPDGKGLPVLLRQYANLGGDIICLNLDQQFSNALDGLILLDLQRVPLRMMRRYFGEEGVCRFLSVAQEDQKDCGVRRTRFENSVRQS